MLSADDCDRPRGFCNSFFGHPSGMGDAECSGTERLPFGLPRTRATSRQSERGPGVLRSLYADRSCCVIRRSNVRMLSTFTDKVNGRSSASAWARLPTAWFCCEENKIGGEKPCSGHEMPGRSSEFCPSEGVMLESTTFDVWKCSRLKPNGKCEVKMEPLFALHPLAQP